MVQRGGHLDLAHEATQRNFGYCHFGQETLNRDLLSGLSVPGQHDAAHSTAAQNLDHLVAGNGLRLALQFFAAIFAKKRHLLVDMRRLSLFPASAIGALDGDHGRPSQRRRIETIDRHRLI